MSQPALLATASSSGEGDRLHVEDGGVLPHLCVPQRVCGVPDASADVDGW